MKKRETQTPKAYLMQSGDEAIHSSKAGTNGKTLKKSVQCDCFLLAITKSFILLNPIMGG